MQEMQETQVQSLGWKDALEKEMAPHSSVLAWEIPWPEESIVHGVAKSQTRLSRQVAEKWRSLSHVQFLATPPHGLNSPGQNTGEGIPFSRGSTQPSS